MRVLTPLTTDRDEGGAARMRIASIYYDRGEPEDAERLADEVLSHEPDNMTALMMKSRIALDRGDRPAALEYARHAAKAAPDAPAPAELLASLQTPARPSQKPSNQPR